MQPFAAGVARRTLRPSAFVIATIAVAVAFSARRPPPATTALAGASLYVNPTSSAESQADIWRTSRPADAALMRRIASQPVAIWLGEWSGDVRAAVRRAVISAQETGRLPVFVAYNVPHRDCGGHSTGGVAADAYRSWIRDIAAGFAGHRAVVILEPDALAGIDCLNAGAREERLALIRDAVVVLKGAGAAVYIDAGHARWQAADTMAARLARAGIDKADGFALNVANFVATDATIAYGEAISRQIGGKHFVIDTSRNGAGGTTDGQWCNPAGQALGASPTTDTGNPLVDAYLWVKVPGESDGTCNQGPSAGTWWADYALGLAERQPSALVVATSEPLNDPGRRRRELFMYGLLLLVTLAACAVTLALQGLARSRRVSIPSGTAASDVP